MGWRPLTCLGWGARIMERRRLVWLDFRFVPSTHPTKPGRPQFAHATASSSTSTDAGSFGHVLIVGRRNRHCDAPSGRPEETWRSLDWGTGPATLREKGGRRPVPPAWRPPIPPSKSIVAGAAVHRNGLRSSLEPSEGSVLRPCRKSHVAAGGGVDARGMCRRRHRAAGSFPGGYLGLRNKAIMSPDRTTCREAQRKRRSPLVGQRRPGRSVAPTGSTQRPRRPRAGVGAGAPTPGVTG